MHRETLVEVLVLVLAHYTIFSNGAFKIPLSEHLNLKIEYVKKNVLKCSPSDILKALLNIFYQMYKDESQVT